jgi:hydrogenase nickel incorporation protein HypA/HybF
VHELSISSAIVDTALRHADGRQVTSVALRVGALRQVVPESLEFYFEIVGRDTLCEDARLDLEIVGAWMTCDVCGCEWDPAPEPAAAHAALDPTAGLPTFRCPGCELAGARVVRGDELEVESIEVAEPLAVAPKS